MITDSGRVKHHAIRTTKNHKQTDGRKDSAALHPLRTPDKRHPRAIEMSTRPTFLISLLPLVVPFIPVVFNFLAANSQIRFLSRQTFPFLVV
uniref:G_PROTEIN_RECEP_F1_2 domain-containing protein n=1 Tax=Panagrellus redivivus TaxID=6233 RepID=A0A7E4WBZ8_PANRE